jgi:beta-phosphoglucomutase-like phosphatase (HAD superfamily)
MIKNKYNLQIYCDMDGVLVDFGKQIEKYAKRVYKDFSYKNFNISQKQFWKIIDDEGVKFWSDMD